MNVSTDLIDKRQKKKKKEKEKDYGWANIASIHLPQTTKMLLENHKRQFYKFLKYKKKGLEKKMNE